MEPYINYLETQLSNKEAIIKEIYEPIGKATLLVQKMMHRETDKDKEDKLNTIYGLLCEATNKFDLKEIYKIILDKEDKL
jgi:hypothetical protein